MITHLKKKKKWLILSISNPFKCHLIIFFYYVGAKSESADMTFGKTGFFQTLLAYSDKDLWLSWVENEKNVCVHLYTHTHTHTHTHTPHIWVLSLPAQTHGGVEGRGCFVDFMYLALFMWDKYREDFPLLFCHWSSAEPLWNCSTPSDLRAKVNHILREMTWNVFIQPTRKHHVSLRNWSCFLFPC